MVRPVSGPSGNPVAGIPPRTGDVVVIKAVESRGDGVWIVSVSGRLLRAETDKALVPGAAYRAKVSWNQDRLILKIIPGPGGALPVQSRSDDLARLAGRMGVAAKPEFLERVRRLGERNGDKADAVHVRARLLADEHGDEGPETALSLLRSLLPKGFSGDRDGGGENPRDQRKEEDAGDPPIDVRFGLDPADAGRLSAFNRIQGESGGWVILPFVSKKGRARREGYLAFRPSTGEAVYCVTDRGSPIRFRLNSGPEPRTLTFHDPGLAGDRREAWLGFAGAMAESLGLRVGIGDGALDGLDPVPPDRDPGPVDVAG